MAALSVKSSIDKNIKNANFEKKWPSKHGCHGYVNYNHRRFKMFSDKFSQKSLSLAVIAWMLLKLFTFFIEGPPLGVIRDKLKWITDF